MSEDSKLTLIWCGAFVLLLLALIYGPKIATRLIAGPQERSVDEPKNAEAVPRARTGSRTAHRSGLHIATVVLLLAVGALVVVAVIAHSTHARLERRIHELTDEVDDLDGRLQAVERH